MTMSFTEQPKSSPDEPSGTKSSNPESMIDLDTIMIPELKQPLEIEDKQLILFRQPNFFVRTIYQQDYRRDPLRKPSGLTEAMPKVMREQEDHIAASPTRQMPNIEPINPHPKRLPIPPWLEKLVIFLGLVISALAHSFNMFAFPRYELDEGTYMSSAWSIIHGSITPYPYGYGHPPLAWIQIAAWIQLTGGFFTFGNAINSGRVLMLFYALGSGLLVYLIARRFGGSRAAALLAMLLFSLSPLSLDFQRQVLLDNVGTFWLLLSIYLLMISDSRLLYIVLGALTFGIAILSKEIFILFLPAIIYTVWLHTTKFQRKFMLVSFIYTVIAVISTFVLMAILKGELLPPGILPGDTHDHLSMFATFLGQAGRTQSEGRFVDSWYAWSHADNLLMQLSIFTIAFNLLVGWWNRKLLLLAVFGISFWLLLLRGGVVLSFYIIPLIPLVALNTAMAASTILGWLRRVVRIKIVSTILLSAAILALVPYDIANASIVFTQQPTQAQTDAMGWIRTNIPHSAFIVINSYLFMDLRESGGTGVGRGSTYPYANVYWNVAYDPELHDQMLQQNWDRIDYIVTDSEMLHDIQSFGGPMKLINDALSHSIQRAQFEEGDHNAKIVIKIYQVIHKQAQSIAARSPGPQSPSNFKQATIYDKKSVSKSSGLLL